jgi:hypothetical protein
MPTIKVSILVEVDDVPVPNFPIVRRLTTQDAQPLRTTRPSNPGVFTPLPSGEIATIAVAMLQANQTLAVALNNRIDAGFTMNPNGIMVLVDTALNAVSIANATGSIAQVSALIAGT